MHPKNISIKEFSYHLPEDRIAKHPLPNRADAQLLVYNNGEITQNQYFNLANYLPNNSCLVFNNTKVVEARLLFKTTTNATIEIFCLEPSAHYADITAAMLTTKKVIWHCLVGKAKKWAVTEILTQTIVYNQKPFLLKAKLLSKEADFFVIEFEWEVTLSFAEVLHLAGIIPLPPYIKREVTENDKTSYQTTYAKHDGSVAAPTAGLHFTPEIFTSLQQKNINSCYVTLHVGAGTFKPVKATTMQDHYMHSEFIDVSVESMEQLYRNLDNTIIAVGTTSLRTIETLYWLGVKCITEANFKLTELSSNNALTQWEPYELPHHFTKKEALTALLQHLQTHHMQRLITKTQIIIAPGYSLKIANALITNFHQPNSTLLLLVAAIIGEDWRKVYNYALENGFRFLSYGDGSLLWGNKASV